MGGFSGFSEVRRELQRGFRGQLCALALETGPDAFEFLGQREYVSGRCLATGRVVRATLADRRGYEGRPSLADLRERLGGKGVLVMSDCAVNRNGTYEAYMGHAFPAGSVVYADGFVRVSPPAQRDGGGWGQSIQHLRTSQAVACGLYGEVIDAVLAALASPGPGRSAAMVRGFHGAKGTAMAFEVGSVFDPDTRSYLPPEASFDAFLASGDVFISGMNTAASGMRCMDIVGNLLDRHPDEVAWEVIPKRTYSLGGIVAEAAGLGTRRDPSEPYRVEGRNWTGCLPSVIAFVERGGVHWPRVVAPLHAAGRPVSALWVPTAHVEPPAARRPPAPAHPGQQPLPFARRAPRGPVAGDPMLDPDAPPPAPPDLGAPAFAGFPPDAAGVVPPAADALGGEDLAALASLDAAAIEELRGIAAA